MAATLTYKSVQAQSDRATFLLQKIKEFEGRYEHEPFAKELVDGKDRLQIIQNRSKGMVQSLQQSVGLWDLRKRNDELVALDKVLAKLEGKYILVHDIFVQLKDYGKDYDSFSKYIDECRFTPEQLKQFLPQNFFKLTGETPVRTTDGTSYYTEPLSENLKKFIGMPMLNGHGLVILANFFGGRISVQPLSMPVNSSSSAANPATSLAANPATIQSDATKRKTCYMLSEDERARISHVEMTGGRRKRKTKRRKWKRKSVRRTRG